MKEYIFKNAVVCVSRPELSEEERAKRERAILIALQQCGREMTEKKVTA